MMKKQEIAQLFVGVVMLVGNIIDVIVSIILIIGGHYITGGIILLLAIMFLSVWFIAAYYAIKFPED